MATDRRNFLKLLGAGAVTAAFPRSIRRALAIPAAYRTGTIQDVEHIVVLMQENRSFDHFFGTLRGVRGYGDPRAIRLPSGNSVFQQPNGSATLLPFHPDAPNLGLQFMQDLPHGWTDQHQAWNGGKSDQWVAAKGSTTTMAYLTRDDIPFQYALADAFTVCDAYHCSLLGPTDPNRYHMWTGWVGNDGSGGGPVIDNAEAGYGWSTYPERLQAADVTWKVYQDVGLGLSAAQYWGWTSDAYIGNYGDNSLLYFHQYQNSQPGSPLYQAALTGTNISVGGTLFDQFRADVAAGTLPQVSWIVAPEAYCEHPNWPPGYGAWYVSQMLDALTANPEVWSKTVLFLTYDENDGLFDHMVPPTPPQTRAEGISTVPTTNEIFPGNSEYATGPYGLGFRVPMIVISPWSKGGWVDSEVFDHTSLIRFIEARFGVTEPNITPWRRSVVGDLTSTLDFRQPDARMVSLPSTSGDVPPDNERHPDYVPAAPTTQALPKQEPGVRPARALPYVLDAIASAKAVEKAVKIDFVNSGAATVVFQVRSADGTGPWTYTVDAGGLAFDTWSFTGVYDLSVYGPNGFFRELAGTLDPSNANLSVRAFYEGGRGITLEIRNLGAARAEVDIHDGYRAQKQQVAVDAGKSVAWHQALEASFGWYDLTITVASDSSFVRRIAGHVENGGPSISDPALGA
jgi:phospholipase C